MPGPEWEIPTRSRPWTIRAASTIRDSDCVYVNSPGNMPGDFDALDTATARGVALAMLAACDYADHVRAGLSQSAAIEAVASGLRLVRESAR